MEHAPAAFRLLGDPTRWRIVAFLAAPVPSCCSRDDGVCGCDLEELLGLTQATVSHHMKLLVEAGLVAAERRGRWVYYELVPEALRELAGTLTALASMAAEVRATVDGSRALAAAGLPTAIAPATPRSAG